jgi:hypothetical protein
VVQQVAHIVTRSEVSGPGESKSVGRENLGAGESRATLVVQQVTQSLPVVRSRDREKVEVSGE